MKALKRNFIRLKFIFLTFIDNIITHQKTFMHCLSASSVCIEDWTLSETDVPKIKLKSKFLIKFTQFTQNRRDRRAAQKLNKKGASVSSICFVCLHTICTHVFEDLLHHFFLFHCLYHVQTVSILPWKYQSQMTNHSIFQTAHMTLCRYFHFTLHGYLKTTHVSTLLTLLKMLFLIMSTKWIWDFYYK